jgi:hypothetical protein
MKQDNNDGVYVDLGCLLDFRLSVLAEIDVAQAQSLLNGTDYFNRTVDEFDGFGVTKFKQMYLDRAERIESFLNAPPTQLNLALLEIIKDIRLQRTNTPYTNGAEVIVNTYPYVLANEAAEELGIIIHERLLGLAPVTVIHCGPTELTPKYCKSAFSAMFIYDYNEWLEIHHKTIAADLSNRMVEIVLFAPRLLPVMPVQDEDQQRNSVAFMADKFAQLEKAASPMITLKLLDVRLFSILNHGITHTTK